MVKSLIQALCLVAAASTAIAMPYDYDGTPALTTQDKTEWPFSELIRESPFEYHRQAAAMAAGVASRTRPPCGHGGSLLGGSNSSFFISVVNDNDAFEYSGNTYLGWVNQPIYSPWNCQQACKALNATGTKCNSYNTYYVRSPTVTPRTDTSCPNPSSMTTIACALWKNKLYPWDSINTGEMRGKNFTVIIAGSNLYQRNNTDPL
ncbi:hypothetical protein UCDDA912_g07247 [Diaporthe ampelina]|uniref:Uncharacterized protein n=1 Tax=Diaporthe ampelina TaxID=1214573 RepID=A0A0G2HXY6_9PEZI|nr:hypothetical protein UCDDA912_g07247 [Diaporthe ampelina]